MGKDVLFLITARGGSKGVPGKNLRQLAGLSLVGFKVRSALRSQHCVRLIISTDNADIRAEAEAHGAAAPFVRPASLATDVASSDEVVLHAMNYIEKTENRQYDAIMVLEPSSPFARGVDYDAAIDLFERVDAGCVVGMCQTEINSIFIGPLAEDGKANQIIQAFASVDDRRRQAFRPEFTMNGALYLVAWDLMQTTGSIYGAPNRTYGHTMDRAHSMNVDTMYDLKLAEYFVREGLLDMADWN